MELSPNNNNVKRLIATIIRMSLDPWPNLSTACKRHFFLAEFFSLFSIDYAIFSIYQKLIKTIASQLSTLARIL